MRALLSVYDKTGLTDFARALHDSGYALVSTGGTQAAIANAGIPVQHVEDLTGFPEILDGRVKSLHPAIYGGILARRDIAEHNAQLAEHGIGTIDVVASNLYPFVDTVSRPDATLIDALENIDIGGPTMIRGAAKNFPHVIVVVDPADYGWIAERLAAGEDLTQDERRSLARKAFQHVALYDTTISQYLGEDALELDETTFGFSRLSTLRYGENPHQQAGLYAAPLSSGGIVRAKQLHGIDMSYTNYLDADAAWRVVADFEQPAATVIKHTNPCGLAVHDNQPTAYRRAFEGDSVSAYGGIVAFNSPLTAETAQAMRGVLCSTLSSPRLTKRRRLMYCADADAHACSKCSPHPVRRNGLDVRLVSGGALVQQTDDIAESPARLEGRYRAPAQPMPNLQTSRSRGRRQSISSPTQSSLRRTTPWSAWARGSPTA